MTIKRILTVLITFAAALLTVCAVTVCAGADLIPPDRYGDFEYWEWSDGSVSIEGYTGSSANVIVPSVINGKKVTDIRTRAFEYCSSIKSITLPDSVTTIGSYAFNNCTNLTSVSLPDGLTTIWSYAFNNCTNLTSVSLPDGLTAIWDNAFLNCSKLSSIDIPDSVNILATNAFKGTALLNNQTTTVKYAGKWAIDCDKSASSATVKSGTVGIADELFKDHSSLTSVKLPDSLKFIGDYAFANCTKLVSLKIPNGVQKIESYAFENCSGLTSVNIPTGLTYISPYIFHNCTKLTSVNIPNKVTIIGSYAFYGCSNLTSVTIPDSVRTISVSAFDNTPLLDNQTSTVKYAGKWVIGCDRNARDVTIKSGTLGIAANAFKDHNGLTSVIIPDSVRDICSSAFEFASLNLIVLPDSLKFIGDDAFYQCDDLKEVYYIGSAAQWNKIYIASNNSDLTDDGIWCFDLGVTGLNVKGRAADAIRLGWNKTTSADGYIIERKDGSKWTRVAKITKNSTTEYRISGLKAGTTYNFRVKSYFMSGSGALYSSYVSISAKTSPTPTAVSGLKLKARAADALRITWAKNSSADGYIIEMKSGSTWTRVGKITDNSTVEFKKSKLKAGTAYTFRVKAYKMSGKTAYYSGYKSISARTDPTAVSGLKLKNSAKDAVRLSWTKNTSADGYIVEMKVNGVWKRAGKITKNSTVEFKKSGLKSKTSYTFRVKTYKMSGSTALYGATKTITVKTK